VDTLPSLFAAARPADPGAPLLLLPDGATVSYGEAHEEAGRLARVLTTAGVARGDRVAVQIEKSPLAVSLYLACLRIGAVFLPMNPAYTDAEAAYVVADAEPAVVVRDPARSPLGPQHFTADPDGRGTLADAAETATSDVAQVPVEPDDLAAILYTSGTTGRPKGAMLTHQNLASNAATLRGAWGFRADDVLLHALPIFHAHGLFVAINCSLANGTPMRFLARFDVDDVLDNLPASSVFMGVPTFYTRLLADDRFDADACRHMRLFVSGSAPLPAAVHREFEERTGHRILERYGMTETTMITSNPLDGDRRAGSVGPPLPGVKVRITAPDDTGVGGIEVRGPNVFRGYWRRDDLTETEFTADGWFRTGDLGRLDDDGYLTIAGRAKDLVITGGLNVYPKEVEQALDALDEVAESAVVGLPDDDFGEAVVAVVVLQDGATLDERSIRDRLRQSLASYKIPKRVHAVTALPRNAMGKVEKARLREELAASA
jgi:malonyl-CoA/methylmalonyl-CoA synthetase